MTAGYVTRSYSSSAFCCSTWRSASESCCWSSAMSFSSTRRSVSRIRLRPEIATPTRRPITSAMKTAASDVT